MSNFLLPHTVLASLFIISLGFGLDLLEERMHARFTKIDITLEEMMEQQHRSVCDGPYPMEN